jgi:hypothetical protein
MATDRFKVLPVLASLLRLLDPDLEQSHLASRGHGAARHSERFAAEPRSNRLDHLHSPS